MAGAAVAGAALVGPRSAAAAGLASVDKAASEATKQAANKATNDAALQAWRERFRREVDHRLEVPPPAQARYAQWLQAALAADPRAGPVGVDRLAGQSVVLVDRSPQVQAALLLVRAPAGAWQLLGATAVSTGKTGSYNHFRTPLGVFTHTLDNPDFRAEGSLNKNHIRGYGLRGRRVFDFGWQQAERGWGVGGRSAMRLQMHATDPRVLEPRLGGVASEGCIRIPATLNVFLDAHGVLDADYEAAVAGGDKLWILKPGRQSLPWLGRCMVIVDSMAAERPAWSPAPGASGRSPALL
jgi:hypothetical protein